MVIQSRVGNAFLPVFYRLFLWAKKPAPYLAPAPIICWPILGRLVRLLFQTQYDVACVSREVECFD